jgi:putative flavoprotein involved in K+ transport
MACQPPPNALSAAVSAWVDQLNSVAQLGDPARVACLFDEDSHWREALALTWSLTTLSGRQALAAPLARGLASMRARDFQIDENRSPPRVVERAGVRAVEAILKFDTETGEAAALLRLRVLPDGDISRTAWTLHTALEAIRDHDEQTLRERREEPVYQREWNGPNWLERRNIASRFEDREPTVLIVGGGHAGLSVAARLNQLGIDNLVVDPMERIGDNWRRRYRALKLHNQFHSNHLPYMPFPSTWQRYLPKDRIANWFEAYVECMDIHFWTRTRLTRARRLDGSGQPGATSGDHWEAYVQRADGTERVLRPRHIILATGVSGAAKIPGIPTLDRFAGRVEHSSAFADGASWRGKSVMVIGTGTSAHDVAQELHGQGARPVMVQRNPTMVIEIEPSAQLYDGVFLGDGPSIEDRDLINTSMPLPIMLQGHRTLTSQARGQDRPLLDALEKVGFRLSSGVDGTGWPYLFRSRGGGYYFNVGCSNLIASGEIGLIQYDDIESFEANGARMKNGSLIEIELIVLGTGYHGLEHTVAGFFGNEVANRVGAVWGFDPATAELRNMWTRTAQPGLYFTGGAFSQCRAYSKYLALQIQAQELGLLESGSPH